MILNSKILKKAFCGPGWKRWDYEHDDWRHGMTAVESNQATMIA